MPAIYARVRHAAEQALFQLIAQRGHTLRGFGDSSASDFCGSAEAYYPGDIFCSGAKPSLMMPAI